MHMKVSHHQFEIEGDRLTHAPTGAVFWMGEKGVVNCAWGETTLPSGYDYDHQELKEAAREVLLKERTSCT